MIKGAEIQKAPKILAIPFVPDRPAAKDALSQKGPAILLESVVSPQTYSGRRTRRHHFGRFADKNLSDRWAEPPDNHFQPMQVVVRFLLDVGSAVDL
jgi:hypothetical protein